MKRILLIICLSSIFVTGCGMTEEQKSCNHNWNIVGESDNVQYCNKHYTIYCPKCKLEYIDIHEYEWKELQLDMEYHNNE